MSARLYEVRSTVLPKNATALSRHLHVLGVYEPRVLAMGEIFDDARALLDHVLDEADLAAIGPAALAAGISVGDVARVLGRWIEVAMRGVGDIDDDLAPRVRSAVFLTQCSAPDDALAYFVSRELIGARATRGYAIVVAAGHAVGLVGRRGRVGAGSPAEMAGELVQGAIVRAQGMYARLVLDECVTIARAVFAPSDGREERAREDREHG